MSSSTINPYRLLPSVEEVLASGQLTPLKDRAPRELLVHFVQHTLDTWRGEIRAKELDADRLSKRLGDDGMLRAVETLVIREEASGIRRVINASGVVLHTGLGRAPVHPAAAEAMARVARGYCVLEVDRFSAKRNQRDERLSELLCRLTGAEAGIVVNNNAAAVVLLLSTFSHDREAIVSRGELVEIGGSFRMPDVMVRAGTRLVEVGTTNRTRIDDYRRAVGKDTGLLLKVHSSNFKQVGFTEEVGGGELASLGAECEVASAFDLGSGLLEVEGARPLAPILDEPLVRDSVADGLDVVTFSGDKLLGGPQAGLIVGKTAAIAAMRKNPMYRALRLDKVTIAGLERTLELYLEGRADEIPARAMLTATKEEVLPKAQRLCAALGGIAGLKAGLAEDGSQPGSGSSPGIFLPTWVVRVHAKSLSAERLANELRACEPSIFARIQDDAIVLDPRTLFEGEEEELLRAFGAIAEATS